MADVNPFVAININTQIMFFSFPGKGRQSYFLQLLRWYFYVQGNDFCMDKMQLMVTEGYLGGGLPKGSVSSGNTLSPFSRLSPHILLTVKEQGWDYLCSCMHKYVCEVIINTPERWCQRIQKWLKKQVQISYSLVVLLKDHPFLMQNIWGVLAVHVLMKICWRV